MYRTALNAFIGSHKKGIKNFKMIGVKINPIAIGLMLQMFSFAISF